jgi:hypothetical protein
LETSYGFSILLKYTYQNIVGSNKMPLRLAGLGGVFTQLDQNLQYLVLAL